MSDGHKSPALGRSWLIGLMLVLGTLACYWPVRHHDFVDYDDPDYVIENTVVQQGLTWPNVSFALTSAGIGNWHPLTWLSLMLDCQIYGAKAGGYLTSLLFHAANALLLFMVLQRLTGAMWRSAFVEALFAWHPMHVESVAWVSERKDVLSAFFLPLTLCAYGRYAEVQSPKSGAQSRETGAGSHKSAVRRQQAEPGITHHASRAARHASSYYLLFLLCFACGLMSRPMLVTLPFVLVLLDYWPLQRLELKTQDPPSPPPREAAIPCAQRG